jgi:6,7-dimethyl-8-ribityllumazine synthase
VVTSEIQGSLDGHGLRIGIAVARFNQFITSRLFEGARAALAKQGVADDDITISTVPGSFELPLVAKKMAESGRFDAVVCLGAVIRGETDHYEHVAGQAAKGIAEAGLASGVPVIFGVLTTDTVDQAISRSGGETGEFVDKHLEQRKPDPAAKGHGAEQGNAGYSAALVAIEMVNLLRELDSG